MSDRRPEAGGDEVIVGFQRMMIEDFKDDNEGEIYAMYERQVGSVLDEWSDLDELEDDDEWESDQEAGQGWGRILFQSDVENVEFPVSNEELPVSLLAGKSEGTEPKVHTKYDPHLMLYVVGEELADDGFPSAAGTVVDTMVCQTLPEEVVEEVLLRLPAAAQVRCRAVCKTWLALLANPGFARRSFLQSVSRTTPPLCAVRDCREQETPPHCAVRDCREQVCLSYLGDLRRMSHLFKAIKVDLSFLPEVFHSSGSELHSCSPSGFVCISRCVPEGMHVCVLNPVNLSFKLLPMLQMLWGYHVVLLMGSVTAAESIPSFKVYVPGVGPASNHNFQLFKDVAIYSSITGEWKGFLGGPDVHTRHPPAVACNGDVYTTVDSTPPQLVRLSTETGPGYLWHMALPNFKKLWSGHWENEFSLVGYHGRLLCCCGGIWMLDDARKVWVEIAERCPLCILQPYVPGSPETEPLTLESVHVAGDLVVFFYQVRFLDRSVAYDMLRRVWRKVPKIIAQAGDVFHPMPNLRL